MRLSRKITVGATVIIVMVNLVVVHLVGWRYERELRAELTESARSFYKLVVVMRAWVAHSGGVYVEAGPGVDANPYLDVPVEVTGDGDTLVWRNPAMVTRELSALSDAMDRSVRFHITSLDPVNPGNAPTEFEREALEAIGAARAGQPGARLPTRPDRGSAGLSPSGEFTRFEEIDGVEHFRYFAPLYVQDSCLSCHGGQGYERGDVRGGISVIIPADASSAATDGYLLTLLGALVASAGVSLLLVWFLRRSVVQPLRRLERAAEEIGRGNFDTELLTDSKDEVGDVGRAMAKMQSAIRVSIGRQVETEKMFALGQLSAGIAHEIRNPLFAVRNDLDYLRRNDATDRFSDVYRDMEHGISRIGETVSAVLGYARPHALEYRRASLQDVLDATMTLLGKQMSKADVQTEIDLAGLPRIEMDVHRMEQVFVNLLANAMRAAGAGDHQGRVRVAGERLTSDVAELRVEDNGHGIDPADLPHIFDPFYTRAEDGTGLGLTIVRRIIDQHHGAITVSSEPGEGTVFTIRLPVRQPETSLAPGAEPESAPESGRASGPGRFGSERETVTA